MSAWWPRAYDGSFARPVCVVFGSLRLPGKRLVCVGPLHARARGKASLLLPIALCESDTQACQH